MADISASAAKEHLLKGSGDVQRVAKEAVQAAQEIGHKFLQAVGREAAEAARAEGRKTIMVPDIQGAAAKVAASLQGAGSGPQG